MFGKTIGDIPGEAAARFGDKTALIFGGREVSFAEVDRLSARVASGLRGLGVEPGDRVTLYAQNSVEWIVSYYAIARAGGVINPINVMLTPDEVAYVVKDCGARVLFTTADRAAPILPLKEEGHLAEIVVFGEADGAASFDDLADSGSNEFAPAKVDPESLSTICYTSGTTGFPKGAMLSHRSVVLNAAVTAAMNVRAGDDVQLTALPCAHVYGGTLMNLNFLFGSTLVLYEKF
ncbi:MAG: AMP-binding protein, partial [Defluviicoccus sp.]|nr:AMP-binding protein [Defluviicoccus sp.]